MSDFRQGRHAAAGPAGVVYENTRQSRLARFVLWLAMGLCLLVLAWAVHLYQNFGLAPGDGGMLRPYPERVAAAGAALVMAGFVLAGAIAYCRVYVVRMRLAGDHVQIHTLGLVGTHTRWYRWRTLAGISDLSGGFTLGSYTPRFTRLRVGGRRLPLLLDSRAEQVDTTVIADLARHDRPVSRTGASGLSRRQ